MSKQLRKYEITYRYVTVGKHIVEARNGVEALEAHYEGAYGEDEHVDSHTITKCVLVK